MANAADGDSTYFTTGPALVGLVVHMMIGATAAGFVRPARPLTILAGVVFGLLVMVGNALVVLPVVANLFGGGEAISDMPTMVGWGTFTVEHVLFGLVLGAIVAARPARRAPIVDQPLTARPLTGCRPASATSPSGTGHCVRALAARSSFPR